MHGGSMGDKATKQNESNTLESAFVEGEVLPGNALPIGGAHQSGDGVNFVLFSRHATRVRLELYQNANDSQFVSFFLVTGFSRISSFSLNSVTGINSIAVTPRSFR